MSDVLFRRNRPFNQLDGFYTDWSEHLTKNCLPLFREFYSNVNNDNVLSDIRSYYETLDDYANKDTIFYFLFPSWRSNSLETSILFLGDINPLLFTSLVYSFVNDAGLKQDRRLAAWEDLPLHKLEAIRNTVEETVVLLLGQMSDAQNGFVRRFTDKWVSSFLRSQSETVLMETATSVTKDEDAGAIMEELVRIFREANLLRMNTIFDIADEMLNMNQRAIFLENVCKFLAGFKPQSEAFQNSLLGNNLINQQLPEPEQLIPPFDPSGEAFAHQDYPPPRIHPYAPHLPRQLIPPSAPSGQVFAPMMQWNAFPPCGQLYLPLAPSGEVFPYHNFHPPMRPQYAPSQLPPPPMRPQYAPPQPPPPPMNQHQQHAPEQDHVIYVGNLDPEATDELLQQRFSGYRTVRRAKICRDKRGNAFGFVSFADKGEKMDAMSEMNGKMLLSKEMHIGLAAKNSI